MVPHHVQPGFIADHGVERVLASDVHMVDPRCEHPQAAQRTPMLVRDRVVRVVWAHAVIAERAERPALHRLARHDAIPAIGTSRSLLQQRIEIALGHRPPLPIPSVSCRAWGNPQVFAPNHGDVVFGT
jgi:hypothetical protein